MCACVCMHVCVQVDYTHSHWCQEHTGADREKPPTQNQWQGQRQVSSLSAPYQHHKSCTSKTHFPTSNLAHTHSHHSNLCKSKCDNVNQVPPHHISFKLTIMLDFLWGGPITSCPFCQVVEYKLTIYLWCMTNCAAFVVLVTFKFDSFCYQQGMYTM